jgi:L-2-hydroxyglutarate oxidase LhgO
LVAERALLSPSTGIIDAHAFMLALRGDAEADRAMFAFETPVLAGRPDGRGLVIEAGGPAPMRIAASTVVNAAGLGAQALARSIVRMPVDKLPPLHLAEGNYFSLSGRSPFSRLIYPMPAPGGLGVILRSISPERLSLARTSNGWTRSTTTSIPGERHPSMRHPNLLARLPVRPGYAGVTPKIARPDGSTTDFLLRTEKDHVVAGLINLIGIESPGLTASLAIADWLAHRV